MGILPGQTAEKPMLSAVSKVANCNFIAAKRFIEEGCDGIVSCKAREMKKHIEDLRVAGVEYVVEPEFTY